MIKVDNFLKILNKNSINFYTGVPDSCLKNFTKELDKLDKNKHIIAVNEGSAVSLGIGYYLSTKKIPCIYMQNSGLTNAFNPIISLAHQKVYRIPMCLIIGWRGAPNEKDEPQHKVKGKITRELLRLLNIKYLELKTETDYRKLSKILRFCLKEKKIVAILIRKQILISKKKNPSIKRSGKLIQKEKFYFYLLKLINKNSAIISSTGYTSRELIFIRSKYNLKKGKDFYLVGGMGHTASVAGAYSIFKNRQTICLDGDGSLLMHMGSIKTVADNTGKNFKYILLNNNSHESVGGQTTNANSVDFKKLSISLGFKKYLKINSNIKLKENLKSILNSRGPVFAEVKIGSSIKEKLPRPKNLFSIKDEFIS